MIKPAYGQPIDNKTYEQTLVGFFDTLLKLLHPFMPFITEELWQHIIRPYRPGESIMVSPVSGWMNPQRKMPTPSPWTVSSIVHIENVKECRRPVCATVRMQKNIAPKEALDIGSRRRKSGGRLSKASSRRCANLTAINTVTQKGEGTACVHGGNDGILPYRSAT